jgi:thiol-disulfide isomerase/thioredoxin
MARTESTMKLALGDPAPAFELAAVQGQMFSTREAAGSPLLVMFICNHCPYVKHVAPELARIGVDYADTPLQIVAVQSNDVDEYPDDSPDKMVEEVASRGYHFPYVHDADQAVALAYSAACTPDFFLFDAGHRLAYRGQLDETRPTRIASGVYDSAQSPPHGSDLRAAIDRVLADEAPVADQIPSLGCNIKWKPGNEPTYFSTS